MTQTALIDQQGLENAFQTFNQLSAQLTESYQQLEKRVAHMSAELSAARDARMRELSEKERLATRLNLLLTALPGGIVVLDGQGIVQECNPAAVELLGVPLVCEAWDRVIQRAFLPQLDDSHDILLHDGRRVNLSTCPLGSESGQILLLTDVSERHKLQQHLNHQQRLTAMGETAASLAHQIRTPLSSALLYASNLKQKKMSDIRRIEVGEKIFSRLRHLEELVDNMLLYARGVDVTDSSFSVATLLRELQQVIETKINLSQTKLSIRNETNSLPLYGNAQMLLSALVNLCVNAIQAMERGGRLEISVQQTDPQHLTISVRDDGPGICVEQQRQVFEPFFTTRNQGTGLGLAVVSAIVNAHRGEILLESKVGEGCIFHLKLPVKNEGLGTRD